jgi:UDP-N-acetylmuramyl pentapeptide synthase
MIRVDLLLALITTLLAAHALTLFQAIRQTEGSSYQGFELNGRAVYKKKSNFLTRGLTKRL